MTISPFFWTFFTFLSFFEWTSEVAHTQASAKHTTKHTPFPSPTELAVASPTELALASPTELAFLQVLQTEIWQSNKIDSNFVFQIYEIHKKTPKNQEQR